MRRLPWLALSVLAAIVLIAVLAPVLPLHDPVRMSIANRMAPPSWAYPLGQDEYGRDVLTRLVWGARTSLFVAVSAAAIACVLGTCLGMIGGFLRGVAGFLAIRSMDVVLSFPPLLLALLVVTLSGPGTATLIPIIALVYLPGFTRVAYSGVLGIRSHEYVEAVRSLGAGSGRIMLRTILPNIGGPILVQFSLTVASGIVLESGLSFLGLGVVPPEPSWGLMIGAARSTMNQAPLLLVWPCLALTLTILVVNAVCDGLRDAVDPQPRVRSLGRRLRDLATPDATAASRPRALLEVHDLTVTLGTGDDALDAVRGSSFRVEPGRTLAIVGESGSGKSLTALAITGLLPPVAHVTSGEAWLDGVELTRRGEAELRRVRGKDVAMIFQDPGSSLNPVHRIGDQIVEAIQAHQAVSRSEARRRALDLLRRVLLPDAERRIDAFPHELSGGQRQRVMIAMAIANEPKLLIADEPTTALDVTVQAQILDLLKDLQRERGMAIVFITHSLPVVAEFADDVAVMYAGELVEQGPTERVFECPLHPYTRALLESAPVEDGPAPQGIPGTVPPPFDLPPGCVFAPRCARHVDACDALHPPLDQVAPERQSRCIRPEAA
ncbi:dipeptide/oligopeptide/nickel ABC transporter permease/ATP-binding protein [Marinivivus vitaminiproducens]|uniref:dipeptide/oligopeptide/nickel ABC transporter permease/ATP-binding protein n=1 Tax=Marinivivus vitaminiproducens TaxID=3035935 RepID=UPI00279FC45D|nr:dipeptide/oligopeptide/nickel ABC transporter permease/ATP-binding protein [Geminicoccaceae bacterium SCSIO 64248]